MAQWLEAFAALTEDLGYILSIQMVHICNSSFRDDKLCGILLKSMEKEKQQMCCYHAR